MTSSFWSPSRGPTSQIEIARGSRAPGWLTARRARRVARSSARRRPGREHVADEVPVERDEVAGHRGGTNASPPSCQRAVRRLGAPEPEPAALVEERPGEDGDGLVLDGDDARGRRAALVEDAERLVDDARAQEARARGRRRRRGSSDAGRRPPRRRRRCAPAPARAGRGSGRRCGATSSPGSTRSRSSLPTQ